MTIAVVRRWLKVPDPTALTAKDTLQRLLGFQGVLADLERSEVLAFRWDRTEEPVAARPLLERLACDTNLLQNPNKHHFEIAVGAEPLHPRGNVWVMTSETGQGDDIASILTRRRLLEGDPPQVARGVLWELRVERDPAGRLEVARAVTETRARTVGLLANPHLEDVAFFARVPRAEDLAAAFAWEGAGAHELR
jgi:phosphoribosylformylglycinamidine (FGAM) synthase PurS component